MRIYNDVNKYRCYLIWIWFCDLEYVWEIFEFLRNKWDRVYKDVRFENIVFFFELLIVIGSDSNLGGKGLVVKGWYRFV